MLFLHLVNAYTIPIANSVDQGELGENMYPPLGLLYLAAYVRKKFPNLKIKVTDGLVAGKTKTLSEIENFPAQIVGISATTANISGAIDLSRQIKKKFPQTLVLLGGIHATSLPKDSLRASHADFVALGEGEQILSEIIKTYHSCDTRDTRGTRGTFDSSCRAIPGLAYLHENRFVRNPLMPLIKNLDNLPFPARDLLDLSKYTGWMVALKHPETSIMSTRGCPFNCHFCSNLVWKLQKPYLRLRSPENIMDEVELLQGQYDIKEYFDQADEINANPEWLLSLCQEKVKRKIDLPWKAMLRADNLTPEIAHWLKLSNCWYVHLGIESGNQKTLDGVGKKITLPGIENSCRILKKEGLKICGLFMLGNVWEERDLNHHSYPPNPPNPSNPSTKSLLRFESLSDSRSTLRFARHLLQKGLIDNMTWSHTTPYPGSALYDTAQKYHLIPKKFIGKWPYWNHSWSIVMKLPGIKDEDRRKLKNQGVLLQTLSLLKTGHLPFSSYPYLLRRGLSFLKRLII